IKADVKMRKILPEKYSTVGLFPDRLRRGEHMALAWLEDAVLNGVLNEGDLLLTDHEKCWGTEEVQAALGDYNIRHLYYSVGLGCKLDPCDNTYHAVIRHEYAQFVLGICNLTLEKQLKSIFKSYRHVPDETIRNCFDHCGLLAGDPVTIAARLLLEG